MLPKENLSKDSPSTNAPKLPTIINLEILNFCKTQEPDGKKCHSLGYNTKCCSPYN